jgi:M6 family metalloprotease-like protein
MRDINFKDFDVDNDGEIDAITFVHSGYAAEWGGVDCYGGKSNDRIWSHKWYMMSKAFTSQGVRVDRYSVNPGLWHTCGSEIGRIGVIAHEIGHFLGLPDLYDGEGIGRGIGSWDLMSDSWGIDGQQNRPPVMSVWSRAQLGWIEPRVIDTPGQYTVPAVAHTPVAYKITKGFPNGEYLLIENRARIGFDVKIKQPGLAIWHVDENAESPYKMNLNEGFPGQAGWPHNGKHYRVALLQADGNYNLEKGHNSNDRGDLFHGQGVNKLTPSQSNSGPFPNTDSYQGGNIRSSGWWIHDISNAGETMTFKLSDSDPNKPKQMIQTNFSGRKRNAGIMFDVTATKPLTITGMDAHIADTGDLLTVEVYTSTKRTSQAHRKEQLWTKIGSMRVRGKGVGMATPLPAGAFGPVSMRQGERRAFYVTVKEGAELVYGAGGKFNRVYKKNNDLIIREGVGKRYAFKGVDKPRVWNGNIYYQV